MLVDIEGINTKPRDYALSLVAPAGAWLWREIRMRLSLHFYDFP